MADDYPWREQLHLALLETNWTKLQEKIDVADAVIQARLDELARGLTGFEERIALLDGLATLRILKGLKEPPASDAGTM